MKSSEFSFLPLRETYWRGIILALSGAVIFFTVWCLSNGITTVFMHLFYFPIVLLAYHYRWKGCGLSTLLALVYLSLVAVFNSGQTEVIISAFYRFLVFVGIAAVIAAISERLVQVQDNLKNARQFEESVIANAYVWISVLAPDGTLLVWNDAAQAISGYKKADVVGKNTVWKQLYPDNAYRKKVTIEIERIIGRDTLLENFETEIRCADGSKKTIVWNTRSLRDAGGKVTGYIAIGRDITGPKRMEKKLSESEKMMRYIVKFDPNAIAVYDRDLHYIAVSDRYLQDYNVKEKDLIGKHHYEVFPEMPQKWKEVHQRCLAGAVEQNDDDFFERPDGSITYNRWKCIPWYQSDRSIGGIITYTEVTTERKRTEERLRESERKFREIFNNINDAVHLHELAPDGRPWRFLDVNDAACRMLMVTRDELLAHNPLDYATDYHNPPLDEVTRQLQTRGSATFETGHRRADGTIVPVEINAHVIMLMGKTVVLSVIRDLSYRKKAEEELRVSNVILLTQQETSPDGILIVDESGKILSFNRRFTEIWGIPDDLIASKDDEPVLQYVAGQLADPDAFLSRVMYLYDHKNEKSYEEIRLKDERVLERYSAPMLGEDYHYFGRVWYFHDITGRKRSEEAIRESRQILEGILNTIPVRVFWKNKGLTYIGCNTPFARDAGFEKPEDIIGKDDYSMGWREQAELYRADDRAVIESGKPKIMIEEPQTTPSGGTIYLLTSKMPLLDSNGGSVGVLGTYLDITERKQAEAALLESRQLFADIISFLPDPTFVIDRDGKVLAWNRALEKISGISAGDIVGKGGYEYSLWLYGKRRPLLIDLVLHPGQDAGRQLYNNLHTEGTTVTAQTEIARPGRPTISFSLVASPLIDSQGKTTGAIESMRDISRLREAEAELVRINQDLEKIVRDRTRALEEEVVQRLRAEKDVQAALDYTRSVIEANPDLMIVLDGTGTVLDVNIAAELLAGIPRDQLIGTRYFRYLVDDGTHIDDFSRLLEHGRIEKIIQIPRKDGRITPLAVNATVIAGGTGTGMRIIVSGHDITRQKQDEEAIRASLEEKVILLREVHHRVKNNLQIIISLTNLQMRQTSDPGVKQILSETQNRVRAMSLVHEKLYRSENLSQIDFADYSRFLATQLFSYYRTDTQRVRLELAMSKIMVDINTAVPLGLLMNELISNALKHAFPHGNEGTISISGGEDHDRITLVVRDNGIGMPEEIDWRNTTSLGMRLITILVDQLNGTIDLAPGEGTIFNIQIQKNSADKAK